MIEDEYEVIVVGGGLAGLVSSLHLSLQNINVTLFEQKKYPFHKVCGEYISNEVLPYLNRIGVQPFDINAKRISQLELTSPKGNLVSIELPLGGFSISRYALDNHIYQKSKTAGTEFIHKKVTAIDFDGEKFSIKTNDSKTYKAKMVIGAFGKKSTLDNFYKRKFALQESQYIGVKYHAQYDHPEHVVGLHNFESGYCGVSQVETGHVNICYLTTHKNIKKAGNIEQLEQMIMSKNTYLGEILSKSKIVFEKPLTISNVSFDKKSLIEDHIIMAGDAAGMISPLCGNGMTMAIHAAKLASEEVFSFIHQKTTRQEMEYNYSKKWKHHFSNRLYWGRQLQKMFGWSFLFEIGTNSMKLMPKVLEQIIKQTHGEPIQ